MLPQTRRKLVFRLSLASLACPVGLMIVILLLRSRMITFHDDFTGLKGVSFFLIWAIALLPSGLLAAAIALGIDRSCRLALTGLTANLLPLAWLLIQLR